MARGMCRHTVDRPKRLARTIILEPVWKAVRRSHSRQLLRNMESLENMESHEQRIARVTCEDIALVGYDPGWPGSFEREKEHLLRCLPKELIGRIEHFGSTAVPGLAAKPIVDMLVEVTDLQATQTRIAPVLESQGYDYFWRPTHGNNVPPWYAWFIKRDSSCGTRTHHIHMVEHHFIEHWDRLLFRDYLIEQPHIADEYQTLKTQLASDFSNDRVAYTRAKTEFIVRVTEQAKQFFEVA